MSYILTTDVSGCCEPHITCPPLEINGFTPCRSGGLLGDGGDLRVLLLTRGGGRQLAELKPTSGEFTRTLDSTSELTLEGTVTGLGGDVCCDGWEDIHSWATEVLVYRDGRDVWCGPVVEAVFDYGRVSLVANDLTAWWDRRVVPTLTFANQDLVDIFLAIHEAAMLPDPSPNIPIVSRPSGLVGDRSYNGNLYQYAADAIDELAKTGLDYTAYGRNVIVGGEEIEANPFVTLLDEHWTTPPKVRERGNDQATVVVVKGKGVQAVAVAPQEYLDYYGWIVRVFDEPNIEDVASAEFSAMTHLDHLKDPVHIETPVGAALKTTAPITLEQLIPGIRVRVDTQSTCRPIVSDFRLRKVTTNFDGKVAIDLEPLGHFTDATVSSSVVTPGAS